MDRLENLLKARDTRCAPPGVPYRTGAWIVSAMGEDRLEKVTIRSGLHRFDVEADLLAIGYHLVPNNELAQLLGCALENGYVVIDQWQQTSVQGIYCVGESTGIGGVDKAQIEGRIAALAITGKLESAKALFSSRARQVRFARGLADAFTLREELRNLATADTLVCRCEDVPHGALQHCASWRDAKLHTRCGWARARAGSAVPPRNFCLGGRRPLPGRRCFPRP